MQYSTMTLLVAQPDEYSHARLLAASWAHSDDWVHASPISACGLRLSNEFIIVCCWPSTWLQCSCGTDVDCRLTSFHADSVQVDQIVTPTSMTFFIAVWFEWKLTVQSNLLTSHALTVIVLMSWLWFLGRLEENVIWNVTFIDTTIYCLHGW